MSREKYDTLSEEEKGKEKRWYVRERYKTFSEDEQNI